MKKKIFGVTVAASAALALCLVTAGAETSGDWEYTVLDNGNLQITDYTGENANLTIPSTLDGRTVTSLSRSVFQQKDTLQTVYMPDTITEMGADVFADCENLTSVRLSENLTQIPAEAFVFDTSLTSIVIPEGVTEIAAHAFDSCETLNQVTLPDSLEKIGNNAFAFCYDLESIVLPDGLKSIGSIAFYQAGLQSVTLPGNLTGVGHSAFICPQLTKINVKTGGTGYYFDVDGVLFCDYGDGDIALVAYPTGSYNRAYTVPAGTTEIGEAAFREAKFLQDVVVSEGVIELGSAAFYSAKALRNVALPGSLEEIYFECFRYAGESFTTLVVPEGVTSISYEAFEDTNLENLYLPASLNKVGYDIVKGTPENLQVYYPGSEAMFRQIDFATISHYGDDGYYAGPIEEGNEALFAATIHYDNDVVASGTCGENMTWELKTNGTLTISGSGEMDFGEDGAFPGWYDYSALITDVVFQGNITSIGYYAFSDCASLTSVTVPEGVTAIEMGAFARCGNLESVTLPNTLITMDYVVFAECYSLTSITIPDSVVSIGATTFMDCQALSSVTLSKNMTTLEGLFQHCYSLTSITIPEGVTTIEQGCFSDCDNLTTVYLPVSVVSIGENAFEFCDSLADVYYAGTEEQFAAIEIADYNEDLTNATIHYNTAAPTFTDVPADQWYYNAVNWGVAHNVTSGFEDNTFRPNNNCTRAQIVQFLYNQAGKPAYTTTESPFTDVQKGAWYYDAVLWAVENNITSGMGGGVFGVNVTCTREQAVTFLWNAQGKPVATSTDGGFTDVPAGQWYYNAVLWGVENKVTAGMGDGTFGVGRDCTRAAIVQFLYNLETK